MANIRSRFASSTPLVLDGGLATELERRGADLSGPLWSARLLLENPDAIREVHRAYFEAGAEVGISASYQASFEGFAKLGSDRRRAAELLRRSVSLVGEARDAVRRSAPLFVAASIGCYGAFLAAGSEYRGDYGLSVAQLIDWHRPRFDALVEAGPDLLACETIPCLREAEALIRLLETSPVPAWISFTCRDERHLRDGELLTKAVAAIQDCDQVLAVGINCTAPRHIGGLLASLKGVATKPIVVYPNSGEGWDADRKAWVENADGVDWGRAAVRWRSLGAWGIGGCCRTTPETIRAIATALGGSSALDDGSPRT